LQFSQFVLNSWHHSVASQELLLLHQLCPFWEHPHADRAHEVIIVVDSVDVVVASVVLEASVVVVCVVDWVVTGDVASVVVLVRVVVSSSGHTQGGEEQPQGNSIPVHFLADFPLQNQYSCISSKVASF